AVIAILGAVDVPFVFIAPRIWRSIHPVLVLAGLNSSEFTFGMEPAMVPAVILGVIGMLLLFTYLLVQRVQIEELSDSVEELRLAQGQ
ncbi:MAG TPA: hypothetical protein VIX58_05740, partial [Anaerolineae bacterium]